MKYIVAFVLCIILVVLLFLVLGWVGNHRYYKYRDMAILSCRDGDMEAAYTYIDLAVSYARDEDLINEGLHYKLLFDHNVCEE
jgi:hypothetical protein